MVSKITLTLDCGRKIRMDPSQVYHVNLSERCTLVYYSGNNTKSECYAVKESALEVCSLVSKELICIGDHGRANSYP